MTDSHHEINATQAVAQSVQNSDRRVQTNPNSLRNLRPPFRPGESGNPKGRPSIGATTRDWIHELGRERDDGTPVYTVADLRAIVDAPDDAPISVPKRLAAQRLLGSIEAGRAGREEADFLYDRTEGRPAQSIAVQAGSAPAVTFNAPDPRSFVQDERAALPGGDGQDDAEGGDA